MEGALVILAAMVVAGLLLYVTDVKYFRHHHNAGTPHESSDNQEISSADTLEERKREEAPEVCCGMHLVCEKNSLQFPDDEIIYYDDEELDRFKGRSSGSYTSEEIEEFRDVLLTLLPQDVAGWARSITLREIEFPDEIKDELLMLMAELRATT